MEEKDYCEIFGTLEKIEEFTTLTQNIIPGSLVFESLSPFWGYYNEDPKDYIPLYIYIAIDKTYPVFDVAKAVGKVHKKKGSAVDVVKGFVSFNDRFYNVLRVRHIEGYHCICDLQEAFAQNGIKPLMNTNIQHRVTAHVTLNKVFCLNKIAQGIWIDSCEKNHAYIEIPETANLDEFARLTGEVRNNWLESNFDAAKGYILTKREGINIARIYSEKLDLKTLEGIKNLYLQKIH
jgi:hypothetical protein